MFFDPLYFLFIAPALLLSLWAQYRVRATYQAAQRVPAPLSGAAAARHILDSAGLHDVVVEEVAGFMSDHYDPRKKVLRLSPEVHRSRSMAAVGIAAHESGHALQDAHHYAPLAIRSAAVPAASFASGPGLWILILGVMLQKPPLIMIGIGLFSVVVLFQLINLPVEFDASRRAKAQLATLGIVSGEEMRWVSSVLNAAAWTYVAATLQAVLTLLYYLYRFSGSSNRD